MTYDRGKVLVLEDILTDKSSRCIHLYHHFSINTKMHYNTPRAFYSGNSSPTTQSIAYTNYDRTIPCLNTLVTHRPERSGRTGVGNLCLNYAK